jgi:hypothetical protein
MLRDAALHQWTPRTGRASEVGAAAADVARDVGADDG